MINKIGSTFFVKNKLRVCFIMNKISLIIFFNAQNVLKLKSNLILHRTLTNNSTDKAKHRFKQINIQILLYRTQN